jgi:hypothetical protein
VITESPIADYSHTYYLADAKGNIVTLIDTNHTV